MAKARRLHGKNGLAGCIKQWTNRRGQRVGVYNGPQSGKDEYGWVVVCEEHSTCVTSDTRRTALDIACDAGLFCEPCQDVAERREDGDG